MDGAVHIQEIAKLVSEFGIMLVIVGIFLYVVIRWINIWLSKYDKKSSKDNHEKMIDLRSEIGTKIHLLISDYLEDSHGNRVQVIEFSNSVMSVAYLPFRYMTCTYEVCKFGKESTGHKIDRISTSLFTQFFNVLQAQDYVEIDLQDRKTLVGGAMYDMMKSHGEHRALCAMMKTEKGKAIGYVYMTKESEFNHTDVDGIVALANRVSALLSVVDK